MHRWICGSAPAGCRSRMVCRDQTQGLHPITGRPVEPFEAGMPWPFSDAALEEILRQSGVKLPSPASI